MFKEISIYTIICDGCGSNSMENSDWAGFTDKDIVLEDAKDRGFQEIDGKHYCENYWQLDNNDDIVIKTKN